MHSHVLTPSQDGPVGRLEQIPVLKRDLFGPFAVVMEREDDHQRFGARAIQFPGGDPAVVQVVGESGRPHNPEPTQDGRQGSSYRPQPGVAFSHVVQ